jgi:hypothetical protein
MEVEEISNSLPVIQDVPHSSMVIDLTTSSPDLPPVIKKEPIDNSGMAGDKGKVSMASDSDFIDIIDLTMDSDDDN